MSNECPGCETAHDDWEQLDRHTVDDGHSHRGIVKVWECGRCGEHVEVPMP